MFYRINTNTSKGPSLTVNALLEQLSAASIPVLLLWGDRDPWMTPKRVSVVAPE